MSSHSHGCSGLAWPIPSRICENLAQKWKCICAMETWKGCPHKKFDWWWQPRKGVHRFGSYLCDCGVWERWTSFHTNPLGSALQCVGQLQLRDSTCPGLRSLCWLVCTKQQNHYYLGLQQEGIEDSIVTWHHQFIWNLWASCSFFSNDHKIKI